MKLFRTCAIITWAVIAVTGTSNASANSRTLAVNINDDDVELSYYGESEYSEYSKIKTGYGGLKAVDEFGNTNTYVHASFSNTGLTDFSGIIFGVGFDISASYIGESEKLYSAVGLMVKAGYIFPFRTLTTLMGSVSYAPQTLCLSDDLESFSDFRIQAEVEIIDGGSIYIGYRDIVYNLVDAPNYTFNQAPYAGFKLRFGG
jgi:hypothetical protein